MSKKGRFGEFGGQYVPEMVMNAVVELEEAYEVFQELEMEIQEDVLTADRLMSEKRKIMTEIAGKKCQGRTREENVIFEETQELYRQSNVVESPVLTAWERTKEVSFKEIKNVIAYRRCSKVAKCACSTCLEKDIYSKNLLWRLICI